MNTNTKLLYTLANAISSIDIAKNFVEMPGMPGISAMIQTARNTIDIMKMELLDIGDLETMLLGLEASHRHNNSNQLQADINAIHDHIEQLAGLDAHIIYAKEEAA